MERHRYRSLEVDLNQVVVDNFQGLPLAERDLLLIDGMSLGDRLTDAKRRQDAGEAIPLGKICHALL